MAFASALYAGHVTHRRTRPREHRFRYAVFYLLLDLDEIDRLGRALRLFSRARLNLFAFHDRDHGDGSAVPLRAQVERHLREAGLETDGGAIRLLSMPRLLGYAFNPLSIYFCYRRSGSLLAILYEVNNTFGQRHSYLVPVSGEAGALAQESPKRLFVSPFMGMDMSYSFRVAPPGARVDVAITGKDADGPLIAAVLSAKRRELSDAALLRAFFTYPLVTLKVIAGIHWEALRLWLKGIGLHRRPPPPGGPVTLGRQISSDSADSARSGTHVLQQ